MCLIRSSLLPHSCLDIRPDSASAAVVSVLGNAALIRKICFPCEVFPLTSVVTKLVELAINALILAGLMMWYGMTPSIQVAWLPLIIVYTMLVSLSIAVAEAGDQRLLPRRGCSASALAIFAHVRLAGMPKWPSAVVAGWPRSASGVDALRERAG